MNWLHFCDFHIGGVRAPQVNALKSLIDKARAICGATNEKIDAVFLVGDLAYSGKPEEYARFKDDFFLPLMALDELAGARVFAVPGNHDVDCDIGAPITWEGIQKRNHEIFFAEDKDGQRLRSQRAEVFAAYSEFVSSNAILSPSPSAEVSKLYEFQDWPVTVVATNTAFFSDISESKNPRSTPVPLTSLRNVLPADPLTKPVLVLGHHSPESFRADHLPLFRSLLAEKKACYLHGHEHVPSAVFNYDTTLRSLGFGATYVASLERQEASEYVNSFTYCSLAEKLRITAFSWEPSAGKWFDTTAIRFPDCGEVDKEPFDRVSVAIPLVSVNTSGSRSATPLAEIPRAHPAPSKIIPIGAPNDLLWKRLSEMSENISWLSQRGAYTTSILPTTESKWQASLDLEDEHHLVVCIPGANHVLSAKEVESLNTRLDTEDYSSVTVISLGLFSEEARKMYLRLKARKPIEILVNTNITTHAERILSAEQNRHLYRLDAAHTSVRLLVTEEEIYCLVMEGAASALSFYLLDRDGKRLEPSHSIVTALRRGNPEFEKAAYFGEEHQETLDVEAAFDETEYLRKSFREYNSTKYAALANVGIRFSDLPLTELYVSATAAEVEDRTSSRLEAIVEDHLARFPTSDALKVHIRRELLASLTHDAHQETSDAREFCQKYGSVLLTGDPGSGKTCFVKHEILAYCNRAVSGSDGNTSQTWHSFHVPILVSLSEVVAETDLDGIGLFAVAARLLERRGLRFPAEHMLALASEGRLALFFDGLDEVVSIEKRALVVRHINELVEKYLLYGNRFVVTSRPAAVHVVNLLPALHKLELQGLSEDNIRTLAERVLTLKIVESPKGLLVDQKNAGQHDSVLVDKLLEDCRRNPGVGRLAQNPLLLTLLILIYANSGAPSAKRHLIYEEAIKTLASVRGREAGHAPISTQDLRERLGAVALSVYRRESGLLPTRAEVREQIRAVMERQRGETVNSAEADQFIQRVAESTGLITIGERDGQDPERSVVTFMHHSFLEYFAAIGLSLDLDTLKVEELVHEPRWHEILTLLSGIVGENSDVAPILIEFLDSSTDVTDVDARLLSFAIDCALESEIPSEAAQRLLAKALRRAITAGPARIDPWVRAEIGRRLAALLAACGSREFEIVLSDIIKSGTDDECAAAIRVSGYACASGDEFGQIVSAVNEACLRQAEAVTCAICWAASEARVFRTEAALQVIANSLKKSRRRKQSAFEAISRIPGLASKYWAEIINGIDDADHGVKRAASLAAVQAGMNAQLVAINAAKKDILLRALRYFDEVGTDRALYSAKLRHETIERMLESAERRDRLIAIGFLPMVNRSEGYIYERLISIVTARRDREELVAALEALRYSGDALLLVNVNDLKAIAQWLDKGTADVRVAAVRLLGMFGRDVLPISAILRMSPKDMLGDEYSAFMAALGGAKVLKEQAVSVVATEVDQLLNPAVSMGSENVDRVCAGIDALRRLEENLPESLVAKLSRAVDDYRANTAVRGRALLALPAIAIPSEKVVLRITKSIQRGAPDSERELVQVPSILARKCRQSVDYVIACVPSLPALREAAVALHKRMASRQLTPENEFRVTELRSGIDEITGIMVAFNEFIGR